VDYFFAFSDKARRKDPDRQVELLSLQSKDEDTPLLPLPQVVTPATESMLHPLLKTHDDPSEFMASLMGPGPWTLQMALTVPDIPGTLHFSNKNKRAPIEITHTLKVVVRVQRGDEQEVDPHSGKPKQYDIVMRAPVHMLSVRLLIISNLCIRHRRINATLCVTLCVLAPVKRPSHRSPALFGNFRGLVPISCHMRAFRGPWGPLSPGASFCYTTEPGGNKCLPSFGVA